MAESDKEADFPEKSSPIAESSHAGRVLPSSSLFGPDREIWIEHDGTRYRLRITKRNKLILQK